MNSGAVAKARTAVSELYLGAAYPLIIGALVFLGHALEIEVYLFLPIVLITSSGLVLTLKARPLIFFVTAVALAVSRKNSPGIPEPSDYYFTSWRLPYLLALIAVFVLALTFYFARVHPFRDKKIKEIPLLTPLFVLSTAFATGGLFSDRWCFSSLAFGLAQAACYAAVFLFFYLVLSRESAGLVDYFIYCSAALAAVLSLEVLWCYLTVGNPVKENILFGWGIWNTAGVLLTVLIPILLLGFARGGARYLPVLALAFASAILTQSRNALLTGVLITVLGLITLVLYKKRRAFALSALFLAVAASIFSCTVMREELFEVVKRFFDDNGRFALWRMGIDNFLSAPAFGVGFFGADFGTFFTADFLPTMAHNTFIQLLSSMGIYGLSAYLFYRVATVLPFVKNHSFIKTMLGLSGLALLLESLLDNFVFFFLPTLNYTVMLAVVFVIDGRGRKNHL